MLIIIMTDSKNTLKNLPCLTATLFRIRTTYEIGNLHGFTWKKYNPNQLDVIKNAIMCTNDECPYIHNLTFDTAVSQLMYNKLILFNDELIELNACPYVNDESDEEEEEENELIKSMYKLNIELPPPPIKENDY